MKRDLEELKHQRDLVRRHLEWLDRQIATASDPNAQDIPETQPVVRPIIPEAPSEASVAAPKIQVPLEVNHVRGQASETTTPDKPSSGARRVEAIQQLPVNVRFGCIVAFILAIAGVVFLLFGLPMLLYR